MNTGVLWIPNGCTVYIGNRLQPAGRHVYFVLCMQGLSGHLGQCLYPRRAYTGVPGMRKTLCAPNGWWQGGHSWTFSTAVTVAMCSTLPKCYSGPFHQKVELQKYKVGSFYQKEEFGRKEEYPSRLHRTQCICPNFSCIFPNCGIYLSIKGKSLAGGRTLCSSSHSQIPQIQCLGGGPCLPVPRNHA